jgi:hypothetical protein
MIQVREIEIDFDVARRADYKKFQEAFQAFSKQLSGAEKPTADDALEALLTGLIGPEAAQELLADGRIDTLLDVMLAVFEAVSDQVQAINRSLNHTLDRAAELNQKMAQLSQ